MLYFLYTRCPMTFFTQLLSNRFRYRDEKKYDFNWSSCSIEMQSLEMLTARRPRVTAPICLFNETHTFFGTLPVFPNMLQ